MASIIAFFLETMPNWSKDEVYTTEVICTSFFTLELLINFFTCPEKAKFVS